MRKSGPASQTSQLAYATRLVSLERVWWKRIIDVQAPYRGHIRCLDLGRVLDLGCGIGRNLQHLRSTTSAVGIDNNSEAIRICRERGLEAYTPAEFDQSGHARMGFFDTLLFSHVAEHLGMVESHKLLSQYVHYIRPGGRVVVICPQEAGYASDPTHVEYFTLGMCRELLMRLDLRALKTYSFPFPRQVGKLFKYNENVAIGHKNLADGY